MTNCKSKTNNWDFAVWQQNAKENPLALQNIFLCVCQKEHTSPHTHSHKTHPTQKTTAKIFNFFFSFLIFLLFPLPHSTNHTATNCICIFFFFTSFLFPLSEKILFTTSSFKSQQPLLLCCWLLIFFFKSLMICNDKKTPVPSPLCWCFLKC